MSQYKYCLVSGYDTGQGNDQVEVVYETWEEVLNDLQDMANENKLAKEKGRWSDRWLWNELYEMKSLDLPEIH